MERITEKNAVLEAAAEAIEHLAKSAAHAAQSMRTKPCRDRRDEEDYARMADTFDKEKDAFKKAADTVRAMKS